MGEFDRLLNKKVVVIKNDGVKKFGILKSLDNTALVLIFDDGKEVFIPLMNVASVEKDTRWRE